MPGIGASDSNRPDDPVSRKGPEAFGDALLRLKLTCNGLDSLIKIRQWGPAERQTAASIAEFLAQDLPAILVANENRFRRQPGSRPAKSASLSLILEDHNRLLELGRAVAMALAPTARGRAATDPVERRAIVARYVAAQRHYIETAPDVFHAN